MAPLPSAKRTQALPFAVVVGRPDDECETRGRAAQPEEGGCELGSVPETADRLVLDRLRHVELPLLEHAGDHRGVDRAGADCVDADAARRVFERGALREPDHTVLGGVIRSAAGEPDEAAERSAVDDGAGALFAHDLFP